MDLPGSADNASTAAIGLHQELAEERAVAAQRNAQVLGADFVAATPLLFQSSPFGGERVHHPLDHLGHERVRVLDGPARLVDEAGLDGVPPAGELTRVAEQRSQATVGRLTA